VSKASVIQNVTNFTNGQADPVSAANYYDELVYDLGSMPVITNFTIYQVTKGVNGIDFADTLIALRGVVYDAKWLTEMRLRDLEAVAKMWRDIYNYPMAYATEEVDTNSIQLYATPKVPGATVTQTFGVNYPPNNIVSFHTEYRSTVPLWLEYYMLFATMGREFARSSDHTDPDASQIADAIGKFILGAYSG